MVPEPIFMSDAQAWRSWLVRNHSTEPHVWLVFYKKHASMQGVSYDEAVEQALCFGWVDSMVRRLDDDRYVQRFSPRRFRSPWSPSNIERVRRLLEAGLMTEAGRRALPDELL